MKPNYVARKRWKRLEYAAIDAMSTRTAGLAGGGGCRRQQLSVVASFVLVEQAFGRWQRSLARMARQDNCLQIGKRHLLGQNKPASLAAENGRSKQSESQHAWHNITSKQFESRSTCSEPTVQALDRRYPSNKCIIDVDNMDNKSIF